MSNNPGIPEILPYGFLSETFLVCGEDGVVRVKDGRTLEEYINDPRLVAMRKECKPGPMVICREEIYNRALIHCA